jgi:microcystin-dependent protein
MSQPYVGEIRMFGGNFAPAGWSFCEGQTLPISENDTLFNLIGTTYGGDGEETFQLPNLQSRVPVHMGTGPDGTTFQLAEQYGVESVTLSTQQMPQHNHSVMESNTGQVGSPNGAIMALGTSAQSGVRIYSTNAANATMNAVTCTAAGGSQPHENCQPFLCVNFIISLFGIYPSPT